MICHLCRDTTDRCNCVTRSISLSRVTRVGLAAAALACASACATPTLELAVGANVTPYLRAPIDGASGGFDGGIETVRLTVREDFGPRYFTAYEHRSHLLMGRPFNHRGEDFYDVVEIGVRFGGAR